MKLISTTLLVIILAITLAFGQAPQTYTIKGITTNAETNEPIPFATVVLKDSTQAVKVTPTDENGKFSINYDKVGEYTLLITYVGHSTVEQKVTLAEEKIIDLGTLKMKDVTELGEVVVTAQLITSDIDKTSYNTAMDPETPTLTALEMMRKVPMLSVDAEENLVLKGQKNFKILVNGKSSAMMSRNYKDVLRAMPAASIQRIEVITNPPAKYDAEGIGGIINIVTIRKSFDSYNGQLTFMGESRGTIAGGGYAAASFGKLSISANLFGGMIELPEVRMDALRENFNSTNSRFIETQYKSDLRMKIVNSALDMSYEIDTFNLLSLSVSGQLSGQEMNGTSWTEFRNATNAITTKYNSLSYTNRSMGSVSGNMDYQRTFMKPNRLLTMSYQLEYNPNSSNFDNNIIGVTNYEGYTQSSDNDAWGMEHTLQIDYTEPTSKAGTMEVGGKYIVRPNVSNTDNYINDEYDLKNKNDLDYLQHISSLYTSYQHKLGKYSFKGGFRAEYTVNTGTFKLQENHELFNRYFNMIPYVAVSYAPKQGQSFRLGYNNRISRPNITHLNPYLNDQYPEDLHQGNPGLTSEVSHVIDLSYNTFSQKGYLNISASTNFGNNAIQEVSTVNEDGVRYTTYANVGKTQYYSVYVNGSLNMMQGKMSMNYGGGANYRIVNGTGENALKNQGWSGNISGGFYAKTWKDANVNAYGGVYFPSVNLQTKYSVGYYYMFGISQSLLNKKMTINLSAQNPFEFYRTQKSESWGSGFRSTTNQRLQSQSIRLAVSWNFGKTMTQVKKAKRTIKNEDKIKTEQNQGSGGVGL